VGCFHGQEDRLPAKKREKGKGGGKAELENESRDKKKTLWLGRARNSAGKEGGTYLFGRSVDKAGTGL